SIVYFANSREDAAWIGFDDSMIYSEMTVPHANRRIPIVNLKLDKALEVFNKWTKKNDKHLY
ncbi:MAG: tRNA-specific adenosine deaminase, partial [Ginsengibacter sp.]